MASDGFPRGRAVVRPRTTGSRTLRRLLAPLLAAALALAAAGCGDTDDRGEIAGGGEVDSPGANAGIGSVLVRYAHLAEPTDGPWETGSDVPLYAQLYDQEPPADRLVSAESPAAESVGIVGQGGEAVEGGVKLTPDTSVGLEEGGTYLVLRDVRQEIRGGDFVWVTFHFEDAGALSMQVPAQPPTVDEESSPPPLPTMTR
ncbi:copper chaperone PCu(A)C [Streptomyces sp. DH37]|uniref:copper chaperone PCu(A)C n=1 Tax=Streptomyces sp. DH37 TaxID=3040122 RepID=UPI0024420202|nr:copper chaperone PCu(A)C [Streptomyces sp. DH37]MDG9701514.1 copper chaperone PCu(A)C [Streptomyces sp. DH37]